MKAIKETCTKWNTLKERTIRIRIPEVVYKKFRLICAELDLSMAKQNAALLREFIAIQEENKENMKK